MAAPVITNAGFESSASALTGWTVTGTTSAATVGTDAPQSGVRRANLWSAGAYMTEIAQTVPNLTADWYTLRVWVKSGSASPGQALDATTVGLRNCGATAKSVTAPSTEQDNGWVQVAVSAYVSGGSCTIALKTSAAVGGVWAQFDNVSMTAERIQRTIRGADVSTLPKNQAFGAVYKDASGVTSAPLTLLASSGVNYARIKVWVNPADGYNNKAKVIALAQQAQATGMKILIDFHYSDTWADPGAQKIPAAWSTYDLNTLASTVATHTNDVLTGLKAAGVSADMVQIGNEINPGMLITGGAASGATSNWTSLGTLLKAGSNAARSVFPNTKIILHLTNLNNGVSTLQSWYSNAVAQGVSFDVMGLSFYGYWHGSLSSLQSGANALLTAFPTKTLAVVETAYGFTLAQDDAEPQIFASGQVIPGYPATPAGQASHLRGVQNVIAGLPANRGLGVIYWEPTWTAVAGSGWDPTSPSSGNGWENQAIFDYGDKLLPVGLEFAADPGQ
ncbi:glycoside hydrolase family 53 protein [Cryobacterium adonitolivorans]|nr:glycosyl hydrolase 53 family protein [Cryobacterium adonitolivorans]